MCNTRSKVYLQSMKTYILSVNTLMWNLTSERHDNCAPCLGLILPIRWVTPPPTFSVWSVSLMALYCNNFAFGLSSVSIYLHDFLRYDDLIAYIYILVFCPLQHSLIANSSSWRFPLSECDRTLPPLWWTQSNIFTNSSCAFWFETR